MSSVAFREGEYLISQGAEGDSLIIVVSGCAAARVRGSNSAADREVGEFEAGDLVGEMALVTREPRTAVVVAMTAVEGLTLPAGDFRELAVGHPELASVMTDLVSDRLGAALHDGLGGKELGGYQIDHLLGRGAMAVTYRARDISTGDHVALKMMKHRLLHNQQSVRLFRQEAEVLGTLEHDNIARYRGGFESYGTYFLAMEYCDGPNLHDFVDYQGGLSEESARCVIGQLARALDYLHSRSVTHRDLKPENVMLTLAGAAKLADFGLATRVSDVAEASTAAGGMFGTPLYMAPEQLNGDVPDSRADLYALACIAYEMVAGRRLFSGGTPVEVIRSKLTTQVPRADEIGPGVSDAYHDVIERGLREDPAERTVSLGDLTDWAGRIEVPRAPGPHVDSTAETQ